MANIAVVLPRSLNLDQFVLVASTMFFGMGLLFYLKGDRIQEIVLEKSNVIDVRAATVIDFIYACLLYYLKIISTIPISTTWVFIGLLGGREIAINFRKIDGDKIRAIKLLVKDTVYAFIGLLVSVLKNRRGSPSFKIKIKDTLKHSAVGGSTAIALEYVLFG